MGHSALAHQTYSMQHKAKTGGVQYIDFSRWTLHWHVSSRLPAIAEPRHLYRSSRRTLPNNIASSNFRIYHEHVPSSECLPIIFAKMQLLYLNLQMQM
jgi:hypothetical protein